MYLGKLGNCRSLGSIYSQHRMNKNSMASYKSKLQPIGGMKQMTNKNDQFWNQREATLSDTRRKEIERAKVERPKTPSRMLLSPNMY